MTDPASRAAIAAGVLAVLAIGCGRGNDTYWRGTVNGEEFRFGQIDLVSMALPDGRVFFALGQDPAAVNIVTAVPSGSVQWRSAAQGVDDLVGRPVDLSNVDDQQLCAVMQLSLPNDIGVHHDAESTLSFVVTRVDRRMVEGTVNGADLVWISMTDDEMRRVSLASRFRARLVVQ